MSQLERNAISPANAISEILTRKEQQGKNVKEQRVRDEKYPENRYEIRKGAG